jgi:hypothetical protein
MGPAAHHCTKQAGVGGITPITGGCGKYCVVTCTTLAASSPMRERAW